MTRLPCAAFLALSLAGCAFDEPSAAVVEEGTLKVGEPRTVELAFLRFDVTNFERRMTRKDILALPADVRDRMWLLDLDLSSGPSKPQLLDNALAAIRALDPDTLEPAERNMQALLMMTPDTANLENTSIEQLIRLAPLMGVAPERVLADLFHIDVEDTFLSDQVLAQVILEQVIGTHPNAKTRLGPKTEENPEGIYSVDVGRLPVMLTDVVSDFATFSERYGPIGAHPGFVAGEAKTRVLEENFALTVRANANALPYRGVDLTDGSLATVSSVRSQAQALFDFDDPNWLRIEGLVQGVPIIETLTFRIVEHPERIEGGRSPMPHGIGSSPAWQLAPWTLERVLIGAAQRAFVNLNSAVAYTPPTREDPLFEARVVDGWQSIEVKGGIGSPPPASYVWDMLLEIAQVRLHDGGLAEGEANVEFTLSNVPLGTDTATLEEIMRKNLAETPEALVGIAEEIIDNTRGAADFYYYKANPGNPRELEGDWLFFVTENDLEKDGDTPLREYKYEKPGFYADAMLTEKVSDKLALDGDSQHEKVRLQDHTRLFVQDDEGSVFELRVGPKLSPNRITLTIERVR